MMHITMKQITMENGHAQTNFFYIQWNFEILHDRLRVCPREGDSC